ncbi:MAG: NAD(P)H-dependent glycerol-3-phosphate dehydrogenase [Patescibacteria group bacterium]|nr:NAD(P)H-dependent glycerol-3-phosphate dehydrogenase [Patescibacteria group bacterium]
MKRPIAILGAGNVGTAAAILLAKHKCAIRMHCIEPDVLEEINRDCLNTKYLHGFCLPKNIRAFPDVKDTVKNAHVVVVAVPSSVLCEVVAIAAPFLSKDTVVTFFTKGLSKDCGLPIALAAMEALPPANRKNACVIGGPAIAVELAEGKPAGIILAGQSQTGMKKISRLLHSHNLKVARSKDFIGVGYAMALKNVYAIALGMCDGLNFTMNTKAFVMTLALNEMSRILSALGAENNTILSLAGVGDLLVTGFSSHGRNRTYGERLVGAKSKDPKELGLTTVEGIAATQVTMQLIRKHKLKAPLLETIAKCLSRSQDYEKPFVDYLKKL